MNTYHVQSILGWKLSQLFIPEFNAHRWPCRKNFLLCVQWYIIKRKKKSRFWTLNLALIMGFHALLLHEVQFLIYFYARRDGRAVECGGLENRWARKGSGGSNPSLSAKKNPSTSLKDFFWETHGRIYSGLLICFFRLTLHIHSWWLWESS